MDPNAAIADIESDEGSDRTPSPPPRDDDQLQEDQWNAGRISESASTVRGLPEYVVEELERIRARQRDAEGVTPIANAFHEHHIDSESNLQQAPPPPFLMPLNLAGSALGTSYAFPSIPTSPRLTGADSSALPSPPSSPADSVSSLPSVTSSFFFSSAAASPGVGPIRHLPEQVHDSSQEHPTQATKPAQEPRHNPPPTYRRRRTTRPQQSYHDESSSSIESSPSSLELLTGPTSSHRGSSRARGVWIPHGRGHYSDAAGATSGLIIPSLALPPALKRPTPYGQTLGEVRLLVLARQGANVGGGRGFVANLLLENNEDVVEVGVWNDPVMEGEAEEEEMLLLGKAGAKIIRASTDWVEHADAHGLEKYEPMKNVEVCELPGYDALTDGNALVDSLKNIVHAPFRTVSEVLHPDSHPSSVLSNLVSSASTPLFTALIILLPSTLTPLDRHIIDSLGPHIPVIVLPASALSRASTSSSYPVSASSSFSSSFPVSPQQPAPPTQLPPDSRPLVAGTCSSSEVGHKAASPLVLSSFRPRDEVALKHGLFRSPETLATLRMEAAGRFLRWREVERVVRGLTYPSSHLHNTAEYDEAGRSLRRTKRGERKGLGWRGWDKEKWEREWMGDFSRDVAIGMKQTDGDRIGALLRSASQSTTGVEPQSQSTRDRLSAQPPMRQYEDADEDLDEKVAFEDEEEDSVDHAASGIMALTHSPAFDPLHLPSLLYFTVSMLGPLKTRFLQALKQVVWLPFTVAFSPLSSSAPCPTSAHSQTSASSESEAGEVSEKQHADVAIGRVRVRERPRSSDPGQKWVAVGGLVGVGFCVGVGVGVVAARTAD